MCSDAVITVHAMYVVLYLYYMLLIYPGKGEQLLPIARTKLSIKSQILPYPRMSCCLLLAGSPLPIYSKLLRIYRQDKHYSSSGTMDTPY